MYIFKSETDLEAFEEFVLRNGGIYMQSAKWAQVKTAWKSYFYSGFNEENERVLTALILERHIPGGGKIWYSPAGAVCDYKNEKLISEFAAYIKKEMKKYRATALFFDPCVELRRNGEYVEDGKVLHKVLTGCGFELNTDASKCLYKSPVQLITELRDKDSNAYTPEQLLKTFEKGVRYSIRIGEQRGLFEKVYDIDDVEKNPQIMEDFLRVMRDTSDRNDFVERGGDYCKHLMKVFGKDGMDIMLVYYDREKDKELQSERMKRKQELEKALPDAPQKKIRGIKEEIESIDRQTEHFEERMRESESEGRDQICVAGGMTVHYGDMSSCLFGGARNLLRNNLRSSHFFNYKRLCRSISLKNNWHDLGYVLLKNVPPTEEGYLGPCVPNEEFEGISAFKKSFGADYIEYVGEYVLVSDKLMYFSYNHLIKLAKTVQGKLYRLTKKK